MACCSAVRLAGAHQSGYMGDNQQVVGTTGVWNDSFWLLHGVELALSSTVVEVAVYLGTLCYFVLNVHRNAVLHPMTN